MGTTAAVGKFRDMLGRARSPGSLTVNGRGPVRARRARLRFRKVPGAKLKAAASAIGVGAVGRPVGGARAGVMGQVQGHGASGPTRRPPDGERRAAVRVANLRETSRE